MKVRKGNSLVVIENGQIENYVLDYKNNWEMGRGMSGREQDIKLHVPTVSREHGRFRNIKIL